MGIGNCKRSIEVAEEETQCMEENDFRNVRPAAYTRPSKRPTQSAGHASVSIGTPRVEALVQDVIDPEASISEGLGTSKEDTTGSLENIGEPTARRQQRMDW